MNLAQRAREDAERQRAYAAERARTPSELQTTAALNVSVMLGLREWGTGTENLPVDPLTVREFGYVKPYYPVEVEFQGITFRGHFTWGGRDWRYKLAGDWQATRRVPRALFGSRRETRAVRVIGDLDGWFGPAPMGDREPS